jgi:hypothetical protein
MEMVTAAARVSTIAPVRKGTSTFGAEAQPEKMRRRLKSDTFARVRICFSILFITTCRFLLIVKLNNIRFLERLAGDGPL